MHTVEVYTRNGSYQYDFRVTLPSGEIHRERRKARGATTERAAREIGLRRLHDVLRNGPAGRGRGSKGDKPVPTVATFAVEWLAHSKAQRHKPSTLKNKDVLLRNHLLPLLGSKRLDEIDGKALAMVAEERQHLAPGSVNNLIKYIVAMLNDAIQLGYKVKVPERSQDAWLKDESESTWYTPDELECLVQSATTFGAADLVLVLLAGDAGLRSGEMAALRWGAVDFKKGEIVVRANLVDGHEGSPKGGKPRTVPMSPRLRAALLAKLAESDPQRRVLENDAGPFTNSKQTTALHRIARYAGVPEYGPHALRHCFGTRLMNARTNPKVVQKLLGHAKMATTEKYIHSTPDQDRDAILSL